MPRLTCLPVEVLVHIVDCVGDGGGGSAFHEQWKCVGNMRTVCTHMREACVVWMQSVRRASFERATTSDGVRHIDGVVHLPTLVRWCPNLQVLKLSDCGVTDGGIVAIARGCAELVDLDVRWCAEVTDASGLELARCCPKLTHLYLTCCGVTDATVTAVAHNRTLTHVDVRFCKVTSKSALALAWCCDLVELYLHSFGSFRGVRSDLVTLAPLCPKLTRLSGRATDADVVDVATFCTKLTQLTLASSLHVTDAGIAALVAGRASLSYLDVNGCVALTDTSVVCVAKRYASSLTSLDVSECNDAISSASVGAIGVHCANLTCLMMNECTNVNDEVMHVLARRCSHLCELGIGHTNVSDVGIAAFVATVVVACASSELSIEGRPALRKLNVWKCDQLTDVTLAVLAEYSPNLTHLDVRMCPNVTAYGLVLVRSGCVHLRNLFATEPHACTA